MKILLDAKKKADGQTGRGADFFNSILCAFEGMEYNIIIFQFCHQMLINIEAMGALFFFFFFFFFVLGGGGGGGARNKLKK